MLSGFFRVVAPPFFTSFEMRFMVAPVVIASLFAAAWWVAINISLLDCPGFIGVEFSPLFIFCINSRFVF